MTQVDVPSNSKRSKYTILQKVHTKVEQIAKNHSQAHFKHQIDMQWQERQLQLDTPGQRGKESFSLTR